MISCMKSVLNKSSSYVQNTVYVCGSPLDGSLGGASTVGVEVLTFYKPLAGEEGEIFFYDIASRDAEHSRAWRRMTGCARVRFLPNIYQTFIIQLWKQGRHLVT